MTTVNDGFNRDLNSLVKERRKTGEQALPPAAAKTAIPARRGTAVSGSLTVAATTETEIVQLSELTEVSRVEQSFTVDAGGTVYVPTQITMTDVSGATVIFNYTMPTVV